MSKQAEHNQIAVKSLEFERAGGYVSQPDVKPARKIGKIPPAKGHDELCGGCLNKGKCLNACAPILWIDGRVARKENLLKDPMRYPNESSDYNGVLASLMAAKRINRIEDIRSLEDIKVRALAAMLYADISVARIAEIMHCSRKTIYEMVKVTTKSPF